MYSERDLEQLVRHNNALRRAAVGCLQGAGFDVRDWDEAEMVLAYLGAKGQRFISGVSETTTKLVMEVLARSSLIAEASKHVKFEAGTVGLVGQCPFCEDGELVIIPRKKEETWACSQCGEGDVLAFTMKARGLLMDEALEYLAEQVGVELPKGRVTGSLNVDKIRKSLEVLCRERRFTKCT